MNNKNYIINLRKLINRYNYLYYVLGKPVVHDNYYDNLLNKLEYKEKIFLRDTNKNSPSKQLGYNENYLNIIKEYQSEDMLSLDKAFSKLDITKFIYNSCKILEIYKENNIICEPKIDGLAITLVYQNKILKKVITRKDGISIENLDNIFYKINNIPKKICNNEIKNQFIEIKGELYISKKHFNLLNFELKNKKEKIFTNSRHASFAVLKNPKKQNIYLSFIAYDLRKKISIIKYKELNNNQYNTIIKLKEFGFTTPYCIKKLKSIKDIVSYNFCLKYIKNKLPYEIDGVVYKIDNLIYQKYLGNTFKYPKWSLAYKFPESKKITKIKSINYQISRNGLIVPVAYIYPTKLDEAIIYKSTLHNIKEIIKKNIKIKDYILIKRSGSIIPKLIRIILKKRDNSIYVFNFPKYCDSCNKKLYVINKYTSLCCRNTYCIYKFIIYIKHFLSKKGVYITGLNINILKKLILNNLLKKLDDIYHIKYHQLNNIYKLENLSIKKLFLSIHNSKIISLNQFIYALGISNIGEKKSLILSLNYKNIKKIKKSSFKKLSKIHEIGKKLSFSIKKFFYKKNNNVIVNNLLSKIKFIKYKNGIINSFLKNKNFLISGKLSKLKRDYIKFYLKKIQVKFFTSMSKSIDYIILGNKKGNKYLIAKKYRIKILDQKKLIILIKKIKKIGI